MLRVVFVGSVPLLLQPSGVLGCLCSFVASLGGARVAVSLLRAAWALSSQCRSTRERLSLCSEPCALGQRHPSISSPVLQFFEAPRSSQKEVASPPGLCGEAGILKMVV